MDEERRDLERALRESPRDEAVARRYLQLLRRTGAIAPDSDDVEPAPNPGIATGDLVLVERRARPRPEFAWLPEMDELVGRVLAVVRLERDGKGALLEGDSLRAARWGGDPCVGRSFGFASLVRVTS